MCFQLLVYPMLDDRNVTPSSHTVIDPKVWNREANAAGWNAYLAGRAGADDVEPYAAPARATDLAGLPPAYIDVGDLDLFLDEDIAYAQALMRAGVPVELHVYPGAFHGSNNFVFPLRALATLERRRAGGAGARPRCGALSAEPRDRGLPCSRPMPRRAKPESSRRPAFTMPAPLSTCRSTCSPATR